MDSLLQRLDPLLSLIARLLMATLFVMAGMDAAMHMPAFTARMVADGVPIHLTGLIFWFLILAGLALALGLQTRLVALAMSGFCITSGAIAYGDLSQPTDMVMLLKNVALTGGYLFVALHGPGRWSLDAMRSSPSSPPSR